MMSFAQNTNSVFVCTPSPRLRPEYVSEKEFVVSRLDTGYDGWCWFVLRRGVLFPKEWLRAASAGQTGDATQGAKGGNAASGTGPARRDVVSCRRGEGSEDGQRRLLGQGKGGEGGADRRDGRDGLSFMAATRARLGYNVKFPGSPQLSPLPSRLSISNVVFQTSATFKLAGGEGPNGPPPEDEARLWSAYKLACPPSWLSRVRPHVSLLPLSATPLRMGQCWPILRYRIRPGAVRIGR